MRARSKGVSIASLAASVQAEGGVLIGPWRPRMHNEVVQAPGGIALGPQPNLLDPDFNDTTKWSKTNVSIAGGILTHVPGAGIGSALQSAGAAIGNLYSSKVNVSRYAGGTMYSLYGGVISTPVTAAGIYELEATQTTNTVDGLYFSDDFDGDVEYMQNFRNLSIPAVGARAGGPLKKALVVVPDGTMQDPTTDAWVAVLCTKSKSTVTPWRPPRCLRAAYIANASFNVSNSTAFLTVGESYIVRFKYRCNNCGSIYTSIGTGTEKVCPPSSDWKQASVYGICAGNGLLYFGTTTGAAGAWIDIADVEVERAYLTQPTAANQPWLYTGSDWPGLAALQFDGVADYLAAPSLAAFANGNKPYTIFTLGGFKSTAGTQQFSSFGHSSFGDYNAMGIYLSKWHITRRDSSGVVYIATSTDNADVGRHVFEEEYAVVRHRLLVDGVEKIVKDPVTTGALALDRYSLGAFYGAAVGGLAANFAACQAPLQAMFPRALTWRERQYYRRVIGAIGNVEVI